MHIWIWVCACKSSTCGSQKASDTLDLELQAVASHPPGCWELNMVLYKSNQCAQLLNHFSSLHEKKNYEPPPTLQRKKKPKIAKQFFKKIHIYFISRFIYYSNQDNIVLGKTQTYLYINGIFQVVSQVDS